MSPQHRTKIHTHTKFLTYLGTLPIEYKKQLHPSQICRYRKINPAEYFGFELAEVVNKELEWIKQFGDFPTAKKISIGILKLFVFFRVTVANLNGFNSAIRKQKDFFVELAQRFKDVIPVQSFSKLIGIETSTLSGWIREVRVKCSDSLINICRRRHPNQLLISEVSKMKKLLTGEEFRFWPSRSLYFYALRNKIVSISESTWYKYASILSVRRLKPKSVKVKSTGIRASMPNELWHADVTYFYTPDRIKLYIYTVIDNFSRFPLCVKVSEKLCGKFRVQTFRDALKKALEMNPDTKDLILMTDGGSENFNQNVSEFINSIDEIPIRHIKALSDGWPSNSMAEAFNYALKCFYLNNMDIRNLSALNKALEFVIEDFAYIRPHGMLKGLTPYQVYTGQRPEDVSFASQLKNARKERVLMNQSHKCGGKCSF